MSPDGQTLLLATRGVDGDVLKMWDVGSGEICTLEQSTIEFARSNKNDEDVHKPTCSAFSPDGQTVLFGCTTDKDLRLRCALKSSVSVRSA